MKILETHIVPAITEKIRLQEYAPQVFKTITSRSGIKKAIKRKEILIDGEVADTSAWIQEKQTITLLRQEDSPKKIFSLPLEVVYEDNFMAVINKPAGYPTSGNYFKTIENALPFNLKPSEEKDVLPAPLPVHRLDNPTTGLLIAAKTRSALAKLGRDFEDKNISKTYLVLVHGKTEETAVFSNEIDGKAAVTTVKLLRHISFEEMDLSLIEARPQTGRTHQIRLHLSLNNFPIAGDKEYGKAREIQKLKGLYLAAIGLEFRHPVSRDFIQLLLPHPKKFRKLGF